MKEGKGGTWARLAVSIKLHTVWKVPGERLAPRGGGMTLPPSSLLPQPPPPLLYYYFNTNTPSSRGKGTLEFKKWYTLHCLRDTSKADPPNLLLLYV